ncbi:cell death activator CIDE-3 isoform 2-T2 [Polymixia lowei]
MMDYAMKSLSLLTPASLSKCVTASVSASASMTQQLLSVRTPRPRPYRVTCADRSIKKGIMADGLRDLLDKAMDSLNVSCVSALVLAEDGTGVDTEEFFQTLPDNAVLMVLEKGQKWTPSPNSPSRLNPSGNRPRHRKDVAKGGSALGALLHAGHGPPPPGLLLLHRAAAGGGGASGEEPGAATGKQDQAAAGHSAGQGLPVKLNWN